MCTRDKSGIFVFIKCFEIMLCECLWPTTFVLAHDFWYISHFGRLFSKKIKGAFVLLIGLEYDLNLVSDRKKSNKDKMYDCNKVEPNQNQIKLAEPNNFYLIIYLFNY